MATLRPCDACGESFTASRKDARFCSPRCNKRFQRGARRPGERPSPGGLSGVEATVRAELDAVGLVGTARGQIALQLARRIDDPDRETGGGLATIAKRLDQLMESATAGVQVEADPLDELRAARERKRSAAG